jgi:hypothetical protein
MGLYDDVNDHWALKHSMQAVDSITILYAGNNAEKLRLTDTSITSTVPFSDSIGPLRRLGIQSQSDNYDLVAGDAGKFVRMTGSGKTISVLTNVFTAGDMITIFNVSTGDCTINQASGVAIYNSADGTTGTKTLAAKGVLTLLCTASNEFVMSGSQIS